MSTRVKNYMDHTDQSICHRILVKLLLVTKLKKKNHSWNNFMFWSGFKPEETEVQGDRENKISKEGTKNYVTR